MLGDDSISKTCLDFAFLVSTELGVICINMKLSEEKTKDPESTLKLKSREGGKV